jgi:hypothetical protein
MATDPKASKAPPRANVRKRIARERSIPMDPRLFSRMLLSAQEDRALDRLAEEYLALSQHAFQPGRLNPLADIFYKVRDTVLKDTVAGEHTWNRFVRVTAKFMRLRSYEYYPYDNVPSAPVYFWSKVKPYDEDPVTHVELGTAVGPPPNNPDNEISVKSGYASFHAANGDGILQTVLLNGRGILGYGPAITLETDGASSVYIFCSVNVAYLFTFDANGNPNFDPTKYRVPCYMSGALWLNNLYDVWDKTSGEGYGSGTLDDRVIRSVGLFPEGSPVPTGQVANPENFFGSAQQFSDDLVVTYNTHFNLPANSRCQFQLSLMSDVTAVGPRNGHWNRFVCNSQLQASATFPRVDVDVWPLA